MTQHKTSATNTILLFLSTMLLSIPAAGQGRGPWEEWQTPEEAGFSSSQLEEVRAYWNDLDSAAMSSLFVVYQGKVLFTLGNTQENTWCHSVRKSFLSGLYGEHVADGTIDLDATMEDLGIDDSPSALTETERQATVHDLIRARSGVYIEAACESPEMKDMRPERGSHDPGTFWYYNNWDFNVLGTIFRQETGEDIFQAFESNIARRIGMQDFDPELCTYEVVPTSIHACYPFRMSARDRARYGQLFLQNGRWGDRQIVPRAWVEESTQGYSESPQKGIEYGYMWWVYGPPATNANTPYGRIRGLRFYAASGYGGQFIIVVPDADMVIVTTVDVYAGGDLDGDEIGPAVYGVLTAREMVDLNVSNAKAAPRTLAKGDTMTLKARIKNLSRVASQPTALSFYLTSDPSSDGAMGEDATWLASTGPIQLQARGKQRISLVGTIPQDLSSGSYKLVAVVDLDKENYDVVRSNNLTVSKKDLVVE
jgi:hypothetical protein